MNENLNLVELLKDVPKGTKFHHVIYGDVTLLKIDTKDVYPIDLTTRNGSFASVTIDGKAFHDAPDGECVLFPSKNQRDWGVWKERHVLPIDTPVMVRTHGTCFLLYYYYKDNTCFCNGAKSKDNENITTWDIIIPFDKFDPNNIEESLKHNIVKK